MMSSRDERWAVGTCSASDVHGGTAWGQVIKDETQHLDAWFQHWRSGAINVFPMKHPALPRENHITKMAFLETSWNKINGHFANEIFRAILIPRRSQFDCSIA